MKRFLCIVLLIFMLLPCLSTVSIGAESQILPFGETRMADALKQMGLFLGTENGYELDRAPTRAEAIVMLVRLLGKENEARNGTWSTPFTDVPEWAEKFVGYAYENNLTKGISEDKFGTDEFVNAAQYLTFVLRALEYSDTAGDFIWNQSDTLAIKLNIINKGDFSNLEKDIFLRKDIVSISYRALSVIMKNSKKALVNKLIEQGVVHRETWENNNSQLIEYYERQNSSNSYEELPEVREVGGYKLQDLGYMQLETYPRTLDGVYDNSYSLMYIDGVYKMWWCRACPYDTMWYAESTDLKNWTNETMVLRVYENTEWIKYMLMGHSVVHVDGTYYMYIEAPATHDEMGEYNNNIFVATSTDGIHFEMYPSNENPEPILRTPKDVMQYERKYGVGMPNVIYHDGEFWMYYLDAAIGANTSLGYQFNCTRLAKSKDGIHFEGEVKDHPYIIDIAGTKIKYNECTKKFYLSFNMESNLFNPNLERNSYIYLLESEDGIDFGFDRISAVANNANYFNNPSKIGLAGAYIFLGDEHGNIFTNTMYAYSMFGKLAGADEDARLNHTTWSGTITAILPPEFADETIILPNGKESNAVNNQAYYDLITEWKAPQITANYGTAVVDGELDEIYGNNPAIIETVNYMGITACEPTETYGEAYFAWTEEALSFYIKVYDATQSLQQTRGTEKKDAVTVKLEFKNIGDDMAGKPYSTKSVIFTVTADGVYTKGYFENIHIQSVENGSAYVIEGIMPWKNNVSSLVGSNVVVGLELCIFDKKGEEDKYATVYWSDYLGDLSTVERNGHLVFLPPEQ